MTDKKDDIALVAEVGGKVTPPFTEAERAYAESLVEQGTDPVDASERVLDERIAANARAVRERDGDPYPALEGLLDAATQKRRAQRRVDAQHGTGEPLSPDMAREAAALEEARAENERLRKDNEEQAAKIAEAGNALEDYERLRQQVADLEAENERLRGTGGAPTTTAPGAPGGTEQTGPGTASVKKTDATPTGKER